MNPKFDVGVSDCALRRNVHKRQEFSLFIDFFKLDHIYFVGTHALPMWKSEDPFLESVFFFYHVGSEDKNQTQVNLVEEKSFTF